MTRGVGATVYGSGGGMLSFEFDEVNGERHVEPVRAGDCAPQELSPGASIKSPIVKAGAWSDGEPNADFYKAFLEDPLVRLPAGDWDISATAKFTDAAMCTGTSRLMKATVRVRIVE